MLRKLGTFLVVIGGLSGFTPSADAHPLVAKPAVAAVSSTANAHLLVTKPAPLASGSFFTVSYLDDGCGCGHWVDRLVTDDKREWVEQGHWEDVDVRVRRPCGCGWTWKTEHQWFDDSHWETRSYPRRIHVWVND